MIKISDKKVFDLAQEIDNPRTDNKERVRQEMLSPLGRKKDRTRRMLTGGPLSFLEAKLLVRAQLTTKLWMITFYEMVQFPQVHFFETEDQALKYFTDATIHRRGAKGGKLVAQRMEVYGPADYLFGKRETLKEWKAATYKPDPMSFKYR